MRPAGIFPILELLKTRAIWICGAGGEVQGVKEVFLRGCCVEINFRFFQGLRILFTNAVYGVRIGK